MSLQPFRGAHQRVCRESFLHLFGLKWINFTVGMLVGAEGVIL